MAPELKAVPRRHAADEVFDQLASAVLRREMLPGSALPPERELAARFDVSPLIARQAIHRLAELGLVRVRQGGATLVCDPDEASDVRVIGLLYGAGARIAPSREDDADVLTKQLLQGFCLVELAETRGASQELSALPGLVDQLEAELRRARTARESEDAFTRFDERFWRAVAATTESRIFRLEVGFWYGVLVRRPDPPARPNDERLAFYHGLSERLARRSGAGDYYLAWMRPIVASLSARAGSAARTEHRGAGRRLTAKGRAR